MRVLRAKIAGTLGLDESSLEEEKYKSIITKTAKKFFSTAEEGKDKRRKKKDKNVSSDGATVIRLKGYIAKCGVRRAWKKELQGMNAKESIERLRDVLKELGVEGRPTIEKCKKIREKLELRKELEEIKSDSFRKEQAKRRVDLSMFGDADE